MTGNFKFKVLHLCKSDSMGGASKAAYRIHRSLLKNGINSIMYVADKQSQDNTVFAPNSLFEKSWSYLATHLDGIPKRFFITPNKTFHSCGFFGIRIMKLIKEIQPDIIHLHWIGDGFLRLETLKSISCPIVWRLSDMWPFCGAEHYCLDSQRYITGYSFLNRNKNELGLDINQWVWKRKKNIYAKLKTKITLACPTIWIQDRAKESFLFKHFHSKLIPTGHDFSQYQLLDKNFSRNKWGMDPNKRILLFGGNNAIHDNRKGFSFIKSALNHIPEKNKYQLISFGGKKTIGDIYGVSHIELGYIDNFQDLNSLYCASDIFLAPSIQENLANTILESQACGLCVFVFPVGGMTEGVIHKQTGYIGEDISSKSIINAINWRFEENNIEIEFKCRKNIVDNFSEYQQARKFIDLYKTLLLFQE